MEPMTFSLGYLLYRVYYRFIEFWKHWYVEVFFALKRFREDTVQKFDARFLHEQSGVGLKMARAVAYASVLLLSWLVYILWCALPVFILYQAFKNHF